jgi:hypothetical protein
MDTYRIRHLDVIHQDFEEEVVVIDLASGTYFSLSGVAGRIWHWLAEGTAGVSSLTGRVTATYAVDASSAATDVETFLLGLEEHGLVVKESPPTPAGGDEPFPSDVDAVVPRQPYAAPQLRAYSDLQSLFLLDPVHDVDPAAGWPHAAAVHSGDGDVAVRRTDADIVTAWAPDAAVVVNRDNGRFCRLLGGAASAWRRLQDGPVRLANASVREAFIAGGLVEAVATDAKPDLFDLAGDAFVDRTLEQQLRPWSERVRPTRTATGQRARQLCGRLDGWFDATAADRVVRSCHRIGGSLIAVDTIAGQPSGTLRSALPVAAGACDRPDLVIRAWNGDPALASPLIAALLESLTTDWRLACGPRGEVIDLHTDVTSAIFNAGPDVLSVVDSAAGRGWLVKLDAGNYPYWEIGSPFRFLLHEYFASRDLQFVHGAAVGDDRGGVLLVGPGGTGKSTTALICAAAGLRYCGDDYCLVDPGQMAIHAIYGSGKLLAEADLARVPELRGRSVNADGFESGGDGKGVFLVDRVWPGRLAENLPLKAVVVPRIGADGVQGWEPCPAAEALAALVPSTVGQLPGATAADAARLERIVGGVPAYRLLLGPDTARIVASVREVIEACR